MYAVISDQFQSWLGDFIQAQFASALTALDLMCNAMNSLASHEGEMKIIRQLGRIHSLVGNEITQTVEKRSKLGLIEIIGLYYKGNLLYIPRDPS